MLQVSHISKSYGIQTILDEISFIVNRGERVGLIGPNGCGKTTLLRVIVGLETPDFGYTRRDASAILGYLPQGLPLTSDRTIDEHLRSGISGLEMARQEVEQLAAQMAKDASPQIVQAYGEAFARFESLGGYGVEHRMEEILAGLGLDSIDPATPLDQLSGGQRTRVGLARLLLAEPGLLILDEPTNHLDIQALEWLERFLKDYDGAAIIVSHDWIFLDATVTHILELDEKTHHLTEYAGNYTDYAEAKAREVEKQWGAWKDQQAEIRRIEADIARTKEQARHFLHFFLFEGDDVFTPTGKLSFGERARLLLAKLVVVGANCLLLDEPINHLDISARERFQAALDAFPGTILIAVHDRAFIDRFATGIWSPEGGVLRRYVDREEMGEGETRREGEREI